MGRTAAEDPDHPAARQPLLIFRACAVVGAAGLLVAALLAPLAIGAGTLLARASSSVDVTTTNILDRSPDAATVLTDTTGAPMALLYRRHRLPVGPEGIADTMKAAIVAIEDRRFYSHDGVDPPGVVRAAVSNALQGAPLEGQGASTITMQYVKNQRLYALADTPDERRAATADTLSRKLTEVRLAHRIEDRLSKKSILARYLDLVYFGRGAYGVEAAARTWFGTSAADLSASQAALLAGMVRAPGSYDPIEHPAAALARRNEVLTAMVEVGSLTPDQGSAARAAPLGVVADPALPPEGCAGARPGTGFFCREVVERLTGAGFDLATGGYTVRTTLDPRVTVEAREATRTVDPTSEVAQVATVVAPQPDRRPVLALAANRSYGVQEAAGETALPITTAPMRGAGSVYKIFTAAAALEQGLVTPDSVLEVPDRYTSTVFSDAGDDYTVENLGSFDDGMTLRRALAESPNTPFVALADRLGSVDPIVDVAWRLGLRRTVAAPGADGEPLAEAVRAGEQASFTLGPDPTSPLDLANVAATITASGTWCPTTLVMRVTDRSGRDVTPRAPVCERAVSPDVAGQMQSALSEDHVDGTAADAAADAGWDRRMIGKTGTTQRSTSAAFVGATDRYSAAIMAFSFGEPSPVCIDPVRVCSAGNLTGGSAPANAWFDLMTPLHRSPRSPAAAVATGAAGAAGVADGARNER